MWLNHLLSYFGKYSREGQRHNLEQEKEVPEIRIGKRISWVEAQQKQRKFIHSSSVTVLSSEGCDRSRALGELGGNPHKHMENMWNPAQTETQA